jgi:hypothetical protein
MAFLPVIFFFGDDFDVFYVKNKYIYIYIYIYIIILIFFLSDMF